MTRLRIRITVVLFVSAGLLAHGQRTLGEEKQVVFRTGFEEQFQTLRRGLHSEADVSGGWMRDNWGNNVTCYTSVLTVKEGIGSPEDGLRAIVQLFETPNTRVEIDDAAVMLLGD